MKEKFQSEGKGPQAMPSSKVVKRPLRTNMDIKEFVLKDMIVEAKAKAQAEAEEAQALTEEARALAEEEIRLAKEKMRQGAYEEGVAIGFEEGSQKGLAEG